MYPKGIVGYIVTFFLAIGVYLFFIYLVFYYIFGLSNRVKLYKVTEPKIYPITIESVSKTIDIVDKKIKPIPKAKTKKPKVKNIKKTIVKPIKKPKKTINIEKPKLKVTPKPKNQISQTTTKTIPKEKLYPKNSKVIDTKEVTPTTKDNQIQSSKSQTKLYQNSKRVKQLQNMYYKIVKDRFNSSKEYPKVAIRRGIEGVVNIKFIVSKDGRLISYNIVDGKKIFYKSIDKTIKTIFPIVPPPNIFSQNIEFKISVLYKID
jgi:periplasmic protein TonB